jgi:hypothetical protein
MFYGCFFRYTFWQSVSISGFGTFKVPKKWILTQIENVIYFTDEFLDNEGYKIILFGVIRKGNDIKDYYDFFDYKIFENVEHIETIDYGVVYSNSARYWVEKYKINGNFEKKYVLEFLQFAQDNTIIVVNLIVWDNSIKENTIIKIVKSFLGKPEG